MTQNRLYTLNNINSTINNFLRENFMEILLKLLKIQNSQEIKSSALISKKYYQQQIYLLEFNPNSTVKQFFKRVEDILRIFVSKFFETITFFFPKKVNQFYFQEESRKINEQLFQIDTKIALKFQQTFLKVYLNVDQETDLVVSESNLLQQITKNYLKIKDNCFNIKIFRKEDYRNQQFEDYLIDTINNLIYQVNLEIERVLIYKSEMLTDFDRFQFLWNDNQIIFDNFAQLIGNVAGGEQKIIENILHPILKNKIKFSRVKNYKYQFIIKERYGELIQIKESLVMRVMKKGLQFVYRKRRFFEKESSILKEKIINYIHDLTNHINSSHLLRQLASTYQLPLEPYELYLNQYANSKENKIITTKKKVVKTVNVSKTIKSKILKKNVNKQQETVSENSLQRIRKINLPLLYCSYISINERIPAKESLLALRDHQVFKISEIFNLKNTYIFKNVLEEKDTVVFHFQEIESYQLLKKLPLKHQISFPKPNKCLIYFVHTVNSLIKIDQVENYILRYVNEAIQKKVFEHISKHLALYHEIIHEPQQNFLKGDKKIFKISLPQIDKQFFIHYLVQHLQFYHNRTKLNSNQAEHRKSSRNYLQQFDSTSTKSINLSKSMSLSMSYDIRPSSHIIFIDDQLSIHSHKSSQKKNEALWLYNFVKQDLNSTEIFGRCLYLLRIRLQNPHDSQMNSLNKHTYYEGSRSFIYQDTNHSFLENSEIKSFLTMRRNSGNVEGLKKFFITFQIDECVGNPNYENIQKVFNIIVKAAIAEKYLETYYKFSKDYQIFNYLETSAQPSFQPLQMTHKQEKGIKERSSFINSILKCQKLHETKFEILTNRLLELMVEWTQFDSIIRNVQSVLFDSYSTRSDMLIRNRVVYLIDFLKFFMETFFKYSKVTQSKLQSLPILLYCQFPEQKTIFWQLKSCSQLFEKISKKLQQKQYLKIGLIFCDHYKDVLNKIQCIRQVQEYPFMTRFKNIKSEGGQFYFKRSLYFHFEISNTGFQFFSYNFNNNFTEQIKVYLSAIHNWLHEKARLFHFIKNVKEKGIYEIPQLSKKVQSKTGIYDQMGREKFQNSNEHHHFENLTQLMIKLIFQDLPKEQSKRFFNIGNQITKVYEVLLTKTIDYSQYPEYKGKGRSLFEKIGKQYLSILKASQNQ